MTEREAHELFDSFLDDTLGVIKIGLLEYNASYALKKLDPIAYRCEFADWLNAEGVELDD